VTTPRRNPYKLAANGIAATIRHHDLDRIDLGIAALKADLRDRGWPAGIPEDDLADRVPRTSEPTALDYADPTGELALALERRHEDLNEIQDLQHTLTHVMKRLVALTGRHLPTATTDPVCSRNDCDDIAERTTNGNGYRGCVLVAGIWCAKPNVRILCARHRKAVERAERLEADARAEWLAKYDGGEAA
jgi:hypothetical protein